MRMYDLITKKKNNEPLDKHELQWIVDSYTNGTIPDYQMSALLMAICFNGLDKKETLNLTMAMRDSGDILDLSQINGIKVDKHSTGGVGDKTTLVLAPIIAALGVPVAKMSGRGLGHTGGTIDKLECFPGFQTAISEELFIKNVNEIKVAIAGQTANLAPADKKIYALRDTTATVNQMSLIASSIMSKKLASGSDAIVLDVKTGSGAFMKSLDDSIKLAQEMFSIGNGAGKQTAAVITNMDEPLGRAVGNSLEVIEAINSLNGNGPKDLMEVVYALGGQMLIFAKKAKSQKEAQAFMQEVIDNKQALHKLEELIVAQGGDASYVTNPTLFPKTKETVLVTATQNGYIHKIQCEEIGKACMMLGGGRATKESIIDLSVGIILNKKVGDKVSVGDTIATIYSNDTNKSKVAYEMIEKAYSLTEDAVTKLPMIYDYILE